MLVMLNAYLDRGTKSDAEEEAMTIACAIFKRTPYKQFTRAWNPTLSAWNAKSFHATDFYNGAGEFKRDTPERERLFEVDSKRIPGMLGNAIYRGHTFQFNPAEFNRVAPPGWLDRYGSSVHAHAVHICLVFNGFWRQTTCPSEKFAYFIESGELGIGETSAMVEKIRNHPLSGPIVRVSSFAQVEKGFAYGTDVADFMAWHWNKFYIDKYKTGQQAKPRLDYQAFIEAAGDKLKHTWVTGAALEKFFSLTPMYEEPRS
ncbi:MAG: hypothetical protein WA871_00165 [Candidatus Acidiferrales bacterium]